MVAHCLTSFSFRVPAQSTSRWNTLAMVGSLLPKLMLLPCFLCGVMFPGWGCGLPFAANGKLGQDSSSTPKPQPRQQSSFHNGPSGWSQNHLASLSYGSWYPVYSKHLVPMSLAVTERWEVKGWSRGRAGASPWSWRCNSGRAGHVAFSTWCWWWNVSS